MKGNGNIIIHHGFSLNLVQHGHILYLPFNTVHFTCAVRSFYLYLVTAAPAGILGPVKKNLIGPLYRPAKKFDAVLYKTMHFNDIFDYHSHICEKNLVVLHAGLIYLHNCRLTDGGFGFWVKKVHIWGFMVIAI